MAMCPVISGAIILLVLASTFAEAQYIKLIDFAGTVNGSLPRGSLISDGVFLYGMTNQGGANNDGTIFKIRPDGTGYAKLLDFTYSINGSSPRGSLISDGTSLYVMTYSGGSNTWGTVFKIKPDGTGYVKLLGFTGVGGDGANPLGSLISDGVFLYGTAMGGGNNGGGTIFKIKPDGTGYSKLHDFGSGTDGDTPVGSLISDSTFLYGMTNSGGSNLLGTIFKVKPDGTGYAKLLDFSGAATGNNPRGSLISDGFFLYGMTMMGGANNDGTIFKIKPDGTGYVDLIDFGGAANGSSPEEGSLVSDGTFFYGMTYLGGIKDSGTVFKIKPDGTGYVDLFDFSGTSANGIFPYGSLIYDSTSTCIYGMTGWGGINKKGTVFKYCLATGIAENDAENNFIISPNPTSGIFNLQMRQFENVQMKVYNMYGEIIYKQINRSADQQIDISYQPSGIYFLKIINQDAIPDGRQGSSAVMKIIRE